MDSFENGTSPSESKGFSRRDFLKGTSIGVLGVVGLGAVGCSAPATPDSSASAAATSGGSAPQTYVNPLFALEEVGEPTEQMDVEMLIIGGGGTGMAAAIQAKQQGITPVIVEKMSSLGGAFTCTEGMTAVGSAMQKAVNFLMPANEVTDRAMAFHHWIPDRSLYDAFFALSPETIDWFIDLGVEYSNVLKNPGSESLQTWHTWKHLEGGTPGALPVQVFTDNLTALGVETLLSTKAMKVLMTDGKVSGALVEKKDGTIVQINTTAVLITTGGFGQNDDMMRSLGHSRNTVFEIGVPGRDGDGLKLGLDAGGDLWDYQCIPFCGPVTRGAGWGKQEWTLSVQPVLWINQDGNRYAREDIFAEGFSYAGNVTKSQGASWTVFTQKDLEHFENVGPYESVFTLCTKGTPMTGITEELQAISDSNGSVLTGDTIEDLADQMGVPADALAETIATYNEMCAAGADTQYEKKAEYLVPLEAGPYIALACDVGALSTAGGLRINDKMECLTPEYEPIVGLYAGGCDAGGLFGDTYDVNIVPGSQAGWAVNSGRLAAMSIAEFLGK